MTLFQSIVLGILQGLGEFLPISSSGHLIVVPWLLRWPEHSLAFDVALHGGTLAAVLYAFGGDWLWMIGDFFKGLRRAQPFAEPGGRLLGLLALASVPAAIAGALLDDWAETVFRSPLLVAGTMAVLGVILLVADRSAGGAHRRPRVARACAPHRLRSGLRAGAWGVALGFHDQRCTVPRLSPGRGGTLQLPARDTHHARRPPARSCPR